jgi:hypothetical protein
VYDVSLSGAGRSGSRIHEERVEPQDMAAQPLKVASFPIATLHEQRHGVLGHILEEPLIGGLGAPDKTDEVSVVVVSEQ